MSYGMFTPEGNQLVENIIKAGAKQHNELGDTLQQSWQWVYHNLRKLSYAEEFGEATDTEVREIAAGELERLTGKQLTSDEYWSYI